MPPKAALKELEMELVGQRLSFLTPERDSVVFYTVPWWGHLREKKLMWNSLEKGTESAELLGSQAESGCDVCDTHGFQCALGQWLSNF